MSKFCEKYIRLNTEESISKAEQLHFHTCLSCCVPILVTAFPPALQRNVSMVAVRGAMRPSITCLGHSNVVLNCKGYIGIPAYPII